MGSFGSRSWSLSQSRISKQNLRSGLYQSASLGTALGRVGKSPSFVRLVDSEAVVHVEQQLLDVSGFEVGGDGLMPRLKHGGEPVFKPDQVKAVALPARKVGEPDQLLPAAVREHLERLLLPNRERDGVEVLRRHGAHQLGCVFGLDERLVLVRGRERGELVHRLGDPRQRRTQRRLRRHSAKSPIHHKKGAGLALAQPHPLVSNRRMVLGWLESSPSKTRNSTCSSSL